MFMNLIVDEDVAECEPSSEEEEEPVLQKKPVRKSKETAKAAGESIAHEEGDEQNCPTYRSTNSLIDRSQRSTSDNTRSAEAIGGRREEVQCAHRLPHQ